MRKIALLSAMLLSLGNALLLRADEQYKLANIVCFVKFADDADKAWEHDREYYGRMFNDDTPGANSVRNFYSDMSYGKLDWESVILPFDYVDPHIANYFRPSDSSNPDGYSSLEAFLGYPRIKTLIKDLSAYVTEKLPDMDLNGDAIVDGQDRIVLDANNDGEVDNLVVIICGNSDISASRMLWPANNCGASAYINNVKVGNYLIVFDGANGYKNVSVPQKLNTGVLCHEMMHTLGAYDLYTTKSNDNGSLEPVNVWDLMSDNQTVPQSFTAYVRMQYGANFGNWLPEEDVTLLETAGNYTLRSINSSDGRDVAFKIQPDRTKPEYFLVEYRDREDMWDKSLPAGGLIVTRVNPAVTSTGNLGKNFELYVFRPGSNGGAAAGSVKSAPLGPDTGRLSFGTDNDSDYPFYSDGSRADFCITDVKKTDEGMNFNLSFDVVASSGVREIEASQIDSEAVIYNLQGMHPGKITRPGIYIVNGRKLLIK